MVNEKNDKEHLEDYDEFEEEDNQTLDGYVEEDREVFIDKSQMSIFELHRRYTRGDLDLRPFYQRKSVWNRIKNSKLIESVLRNIPIPAIYLSEKEESGWEVIDGQQRLKAFFSFLEDEYELGKLPVLYSLNNEAFTTLDGKYQRRIEDYQLNIFIIKKESHPDIKFDIFERINEGATELNAQELRNCIFRGDGIELIRSLARQEEFINVIGRRIQITRCKDEEIILRFISFYLKGSHAYRGNLNIFLNETLRNFNSYKDQIKDIENIFKDTLNVIYEVFGEKSFVKKGSNKSNINISLFDILMVTFAKLDRVRIIKNKEIIKNKLYKLMDDKEFYEAISFNTLTKSNVEVRFSKWYLALNNILEDEGNDREI